MPLTDLIPLIRCPVSQGELVLEGPALLCTDPKCRLQFEIRDDIPILIAESATTLSASDWTTVMLSHGRPATVPEEVFADAQDPETSY